MKYVSKIIQKESEDEDDDEQLLDEENDEEVANELEKIAEEINSQDSLEEQKGEVNFDKALYKRIPKNEEEYLAILKARFGFDSFKEG